MKKRIITVEVEIPEGGTPEFEEFVMTAPPFDVFEYGVLVYDELEEAPAT